MADLYTVVLRKKTNIKRQVKCLIRFWPKQHGKHSYLVPFQCAISSVKVFAGNINYIILKKYKES